MQKTDLNKRLNKIRLPEGKCIVTGRRTTHKNAKGQFICKEYDMPLEDKLTEEDSNILDIVKKSNLSPAELKIAISQPKDYKGVRVYDHSRIGRVKIGILADTHIGHKKFDEGFMKFASETFRKEGIKNVYHAGDICEGMSGRPGHVYELKHIGFSAQVGEAERLFKKYYPDFNIYAITGNHDQWFRYKADNGADVGEELQHRLPNFKYLGENEAHIKLGPKARLMLFHPGDGTAYANSYKMQKLVESLEGGNKPNVIVEGHYHKALYQFLRNVHAIDGGTLCGQTGWMRGKKIPAHKGFWILDMDIGKRGITKFTPHFYPAYD